MNYFRSLKKFFLFGVCGALVAASSFCLLATTDDSPSAPNSPADWESQRGEEYVSGGPDRFFSLKELASGPPEDVEGNTQENSVVSGFCKPTIMAGQAAAVETFRHLFPGQQGDGASYYGTLSCQGTDSGYEVWCCGARPSAY